MPMFVIPNAPRTVNCSSLARCHQESQVRSLGVLGYNWVAFVTGFKCVLVLVVLNQLLSCVHFARALNNWSDYSGILEMVFISLSSLVCVSHTVTG